MFTRLAAQVEPDAFREFLGVILPPAVDTGWISAGTRAAIESGGPGSRLASPEEIAEAVCLFGSDQARFITGQVIAVR